MATTGNLNPTFPLGTGIVSIRLVIQTNASKHVAYLNSISRSSTITLARLASMFESFTNGSYRSNVDINTNGAYAYDTVTLSSFANTNTVTINGVVLTGATLPSGASQFGIGASDTLTAVNLAACINANSSLYSSVYAVQSTNTVVVYCRVPGVIGNLCTAAISAHGSVTGANFANGTDGTQSNNAHGL